MTEVKWRQFKDYSGPMVQGTIPVPVPNSLKCAERAYWLTTKVETGGTYGSIVMFDGTGVTAGPDQYILVYPKELANEDFNAADDQGPLGPLLSRVLSVSILGAYFHKKFRSLGWTLSPSGRFIYDTAHTVQVSGKVVPVTAGSLVHGAVLRDKFTPVGGKVPKSGPAWEVSSSWARDLSSLFENSDTWSTQRLYGQEHLGKAFKNRSFAYLGKAITPEHILQSSIDTATVGSDVSVEMDLAMAIWYSNSVNAPAIAIQCLGRAWAASGGNRAKLAIEIIKQLGKSSFGRWNASIPNGRYQRSRKTAMASGLWHPSLFKTSGGIMPPSF
jgi:hypothetical protein